MKPRRRAGARNASQSTVGRMTSSRGTSTFQTVNPSAAPSQSPEYRGSWSGLAARLFVRALVSPALAIALCRTAWAFRRRRWWAEPPFLPIPDAPYLRWRMYTAYGDEHAVPPVEDVVRFARWRHTTMRM